MSNQILRVGALTRLGTHDIREADDSVSHMILSEIFETPYAPPVGDAPPEPVLFSEPLRHDANTAGQPTYSAPLRPGITFSDGTPLTADAVVRSLSKASDFAVKATAEAAGDRIVFRLKSPNPRFELVLTQTFCGVTLEKGDRLLGTGPCMFPEGLTRRQLLDANPLVLTRNPRYREQVSIDEIDFKVFPAAVDGGTRNLLEAAKRQEFDFTFSLTSVDAAELQGHPFIPSISPGNATGMLFFNTPIPSLSNPLVRRAIALAIDRREIARKTYPTNPLAFVASSLLPPFLGRERDGLAFNLREAKELIQKAGSAAPKNLSLLVTWSPRPYLPNPRAAAETIRDELAAIGITVELIQPKDRADFFDRVKGGKFEMAIAGWIADTADPADYFEALLSSHMIPKVSKITAMSNNLSRWSHAGMDEALARFRAEPTEPHRAAILKILTEEAPVVPLIYGQAVAVYSRRVLGFRPSPLGRASLSSLKFAN